MTVAALFWAKVNRAGDCWVWTASRNSGGYGQFRIGSRTDSSKRCALAHRVAWELTRGAIPRGLCVLHRCDNPGCVRPDHLFLGTRTDNSRDKVAKGRQRSGRMVGEANPFAKLSRAQVREMRALAAGGISGAALGVRFGVSKSTACRVIRGDRWA